MRTSCLQVSGLSGQFTIPHVGQLAAKLLGIFVGQIPLRTSGRPTGTNLRNTPKLMFCDVLQISTMSS
jgi:hypothetical protein